MSDRNLGRDDVLVEHLADMLDRAEPVPADALAAAKAVPQLRRLDEELARLVADADLGDLVLVRHDGPEGRMLTFTASVLDLELLVEPDGALLGQMEPPASTVVEIETDSDRQLLRADELGRFRARLPQGRWRCHIRHATRSIVTPWINR